MSGFDFDALRDPDAPQPGAPERAGVDARARQLRAHARRTRFAATATSIVALAAVVVGVVAVRNQGPAVTVTGPSTSTTPTSKPVPTSSIENRFVPRTTVDNGITTMPVRLPDGEAFIMSYPQEMRVAQLGFAGGIGVSGLQVLISYETMPHFFHGTRPIAGYVGQNGLTVSVFPGPRPAGGYGSRAPADEMAFQFGPWLARVTMNGDVTPTQRAMWARSLTGTVDANGYLVLHAAAPLTLSNQFDGGFGPFVAGENEVELSSHLHCGQQESDTAAHRHFANGDGTQGVAWCVDDGLHVSASGSASFVDLAAHLRVTRPIAGKPTGTTTTTTTTTPSAGNSPAESATFVSPSHGWALEQDGHVATTTDGGLTWKGVGAIRTAGNGETIRFADATHGFVFASGGANQTLPETTTDGGVTWSVLQTPFSGPIYDLAISRGIVYAVTFDTNAEFRIWSSPAASLNWKEDPLAIGVGGGPIPSIQLVFNGGRGWLVEVDRTVVAGAQLSAAGTWSKWTPPCTTVNGPAFLAAWGPTDLIATCNEGIWGGPQATAVYTSHDAGAMFQRHAAPAFGAVAAADPNYAIIVTGDTIRRSIDGGRTWNVVGTGPAAARPIPLDLGFTSNTQGFVIFPAGQMLMTYDAGATWSPVSLPGR